MPRQRPQRPKLATRETSLYLPVKRFLESLGFEVKGEVCGCDLVAIRGDEPSLVVIGELKLGFNLELVLQGINRMAACDQVWLAVRFTGRRGRERDPRVRKLCRLLGFGLLGVSTSGRVEVLVEPVPWRPRRDARRRSRLVDEHRRRLGDPVLGGSCKAPRAQRPCLAVRDAHPRSKPPYRMRRRFCCATFTAGFSASSAASMPSRRKAPPHCRVGRSRRRSRFGGAAVISVPSARGGQA